MSLSPKSSRFYRSSLPPAICPFFLSLPRFVLFDFISSQQLPLRETRSLSQSFFFAYLAHSSLRLSMDPTKSLPTGTRVCNWKLSFVYAPTYVSIYTCMWASRLPRMIKVEVRSVNWCGRRLRSNERRIWILWLGIHSEYLSERL